jgi:hypothetical protein
VEGKGNGIKTVIVNMPEIAKALSRPPTCKYNESRTISTQMLIEMLTQEEAPVSQLEMVEMPE